MELSVKRVSLLTNGYIRCKIVNVYSIPIIPVEIIGIIRTYCPSYTPLTYRGLLNFIGDLERCSTKSDAIARIDHEQEKISKIFKRWGCSSYAKRKYLLKQIYIHKLGYEATCGHMQCVDLIRSDKFYDRYIGFLGVSELLIEHKDMLRMTISSHMQLLKGRSNYDKKSEISTCLALTSVAHITTHFIDFSESYSHDIMKHMFNKNKNKYNDVHFVAFC
eukprot:440535_1